MQFRTYNYDEPHVSLVKQRRGGCFVEQKGKVIGIKLEFERILTFLL